MTSLDLLFVMGQALMLSSLVYFLILFAWWRLNRPADLEQAERRAELRLTEQSLSAESAPDTTESPHQGIAPA